MQLALRRADQRKNGEVHVVRAEMRAKAGEGILTVEHRTLTHRFMMNEKQPTEQPALFVLWTSVLARHG